ncbi:MAG: hypothetical protein LBQ05_02150 [Christensenellaceae bacterium]|nr:hypothetical protein [Christensenellaceae bacterium]
MEETNNLDIEKLKKVVAGIFAGGEEAAWNFDPNPYTVDELNYIMHLIDEQTKNEVDYLIKLTD